MLTERDIPKYVWEGLYEKWSQIKDRRDRRIHNECAMCSYVRYELGASCSECILVIRGYCDSSEDRSHSILDINNDHWPDFVERFVNYIKYNIEHSE
jgi:hypothetical protein